MKTLLFIAGLVFICSMANAQTIVSQSKLDSGGAAGSGAQSMQATAAPLTEDSKPAPKQIVVTGTESPAKTVHVTVAAQPWSPDARSAEKKIEVTGEEPVKAEARHEGKGTPEEEQE